ncbi:hypothetical protein COLO4_09289 [Corchorus olitorius]|uniref:Uncharacterized protein n=1 Tax=Corchorus olitorius TaxID=93759 RepID=A0A1R3KCI8_9ROSI|nr:hypothetical protein COLO4_09289 [Corchorus olitorius]
MLRFFAVPRNLRPPCGFDGSVLLLRSRPQPPTTESFEFQGVSSTNQAPIARILVVSPWKWPQPSRFRFIQSFPSVPGLIRVKTPLVKWGKLVGNRANG